MAKHPYGKVEYFRVQPDEPNLDPINMGTGFWKLFAHSLQQDMFAQSLYQRALNQMSMGTGMIDNFRAAGISGASAARTGQTIASAQPVSYKPGKISDAVASFKANEMFQGQLLDEIQKIMEANQPTFLQQALPFAGAAVGGILGGLPGAQAGYSLGSAAQTFGG